MNLRARVLIVAAIVGSLAACSSSEEKVAANGDTGDPGTNAPVKGADDGANIPASDLGNTTKGKELRTTADLNLREKPSTDSAILRVLPAGTIVVVLDPTPQNGFYNVSALGLTGWASGKYLDDPLTTLPTSGEIDGATSPANTIARAKSAMGFSYYWGGGAWLAEGPTAATKGSCTGTCPSCTHSGKYGADCSGLVAKAWQLKTKDLSVNEHPFATADFVKPKAGYWADINRGDTKLGDALTYNSGGHGHIVIFEKGDPWGQPFVYECKGCSYGCVYNARTIDASYKAIRRAGF